MDLAPLFEMPKNLLQVAHFTVHSVQTWGSSHDQEYKMAIRQAAAITEPDNCGCDWFVFVIRCQVAVSRTRFAKQVPDIENIPKLIVDAFTGVLYPDDNILYVRGIQVEGVVSQDNSNMTEVWILGMSKEQEGIDHAGRAD